jgi:NADH-quinone oxidoreductase subunit N
MTALDLLILAVPETIVVVTGFVVLLVDMTEMRHKAIRARMLVAAILSSIGCLVSLYWLSQVGEPIRPPDGMFVVDPITQMVKQLILLLTVFTALISIESNFTDHVGEYFLLLLLATVGMMFLVSSENLLMIFTSLELLSLALYIMTAFNKQNIKSAEAALKYFLFGGMSATFMLFGLSLIYGLSGEIVLLRIAEKLKGQPLDPLLIVALVMVVIGFGFKVAAVPFHLWAPDAYQGAPTPSAAFIASGSKVASFFILAKVMMVGFAGTEGSGVWRNFSEGWVPLLAIMAALSMGLGNLAAIAQSSVRRLLAYSAIAHAGYLLLGVISLGVLKEAVVGPDVEARMTAIKQNGMAALLYYLATYALTTIGAFGVVAIVQERSGQERFPAFAGLSRRAPVLSLCMMVFMLSLAGIPPLAGFFGKFYLFAAALGSARNLGLLWLIVFAIAMSAVSLYYYLQVLKQIYVAPPSSGASSLQSNFLSSIAIIMLALAVVVLGCAPNLALSKILAAVKTANL